MTDIHIEPFPSGNATVFEFKSSLHECAKTLQPENNISFQTKGIRLHNIKLFKANS